MAVERINPSALYNSLNFGFSHATVSKEGGLLHLSGQVAWDKDNNLVGGDDLAAQARQALANLKAVLADQGLDPSDLVRIRTYVVDHNPEKIGPVAGEMMAFFGEAMPCANTWLGVQALAMPEFMIEIEGTAALR